MLRCIIYFLFKVGNHLNRHKIFQPHLDLRGAKTHDEEWGNDARVGIVENGHHQGLGLAVDEGEGVGGSHDDGEQEENGKRVDTKLGGQQVGSSVMVQLLLQEN